MQMLKKSCLFNVRSGIDPGKWSANLIFFTFYDFCHSILSDPDANPEPDPECILVPLWQKVSLPAIPVPQHWMTEIIFKRCE
jgi:hypothetical protein